MTAHRYPHAVVRQDWLALLDEPVLDPQRPIIDPHHHLWHDRPSGRYMLEDIVADLATGHDVRATVFIQCGWQHREAGPAAMRPVGETEAVAAAARLSGTGAYGPARVAAGIVAHADLADPGLPAVLDAHEAAGGGRFRGIRHAAALDPSIVPMTSVPPGPGLLLEPAFHAGLRELGRRGLSYDAWQYHPQLKDLLVAVRAAPGVAVVINHCGGPLGIGPYREGREAMHRAWVADMRALAACPGVHVKLGGLGMPINGFDYHEDALPPGSERLAREWRAWMEPCLELFGPERCMFESNFPVDKGMFGYRVFWNACKRLAEGASEGAKAAVFHDTAARFYRLQE